MGRRIAKQVANVVNSAVAQELGRKTRLSLRTKVFAYVQMNGLSKKDFALTKLAIKYIFEGSLIRSGTLSQQHFRILDRLSRKLA